MINMTNEGHISVPGGRVWYQVVGSGDTVPLLVLHGGPGFPHNYLKPLEDLSDDRPVVFYDQLGCGNSDRQEDPNLWRTERFVEELVQVRQALNLEQVHILGHSWGSMLAIDYALTHPEGISSLILASPALSIPRWIEDVTTYRKQLPSEVQEVLDRNEAAGTTDSEQYEAAVMEFYRLHLCRLDPWPEVLEQTLVGAGLQVYHTMWGPSEFFMTGNLANYDRTSRIGEVIVPTLFTCGRYDEAPPETTAWYQSLIPQAEIAIFEHSSHTPHLEEMELYLQVVRDFLNGIDQKQVL
jgi:proline iminopeptidase